jgi:hypothetical protein
MRTFVVAVCLLVLGSTAAAAMQLTSADFAEGGRLAIAQVSDRCGGHNQSPALAWSGAPAATRSFALTLFDPDARAGRGFWHWLVFGLPAGTQALPAGAGSGTGLPAGTVQGQNDVGESAYGGPCPPEGSGPHHYEFSLYALDSASAPLGPQAKGGDAAAYFKAHALASAKLIGLYGR